jgi:hypothetical protein
MANVHVVALVRSHDLPLCVCDNVQQIFVLSQACCLYVLRQTSVLKQASVTLAGVTVASGLYRAVWTRGLKVTH